MGCFDLSKDCKTLHIPWTSVDAPPVLKEANIVHNFKF